MQWNLSDKNYAFGMATRSADRGVRFQGLHGNHILIVLDESPGIEEEVWEALEGIRAGGQVHVLALGNPTVPVGGFYDLFTVKRESWNCITFDAFDLPNMEGVKGKTEKETIERLRSLNEDELDDNPFPYLVTKRWIREMADEWSTESPRWESRVRGQFPRQSEYSVYPLSLLEEAKEFKGPEGEMPPPSGKMWSAGIDVAGPGEDETVCYILDQGVIRDMGVWTKPDPRGDVLQFLGQYSRELGNVNCDSIGMGYYFALHLIDNGLPVNMVNVAESPSDERFRDLKAELYWNLRKRFEDGEISGLKDERTVSQLSGILYKDNARGKTEIESKEDMRKRGARSPDRAEGLVLANASQGPGELNIGGIGRGLRSKRRMSP
jgi:hypothetical protein